MKLNVVFNPQALNVTTGNQIVKEYVGADPYEGSYTAVPSQEEQVFPTATKWMAEDFVVAPIPEYYGLITWNGSVLTVS